MAQRLSTFQVAVLQHAAMGYTVLQTAEALGKREGNVYRARQVARMKLGASDMRGALAMARRQGYPVPAAEPETGAGWVRDWERGYEFVEHLYGVPWNKAPMPDAEHSCMPQTRGIVHVQGLPPMPFLRCACGAGREVDTVWSEQNARALAPVGERMPE